MCSKNRPKFLALSLVALTALVLLFLPGCGGNGSCVSGFNAACNPCGSGGSLCPPPQPTLVTITPSSVTLAAGAAVQFHAAVAGQTDQNVTWEVGTVPGGNSSMGTITASGLYTAPSNLSTPLTSVQIGAIPEASEGSYTFQGGALSFLAAHRFGVRSGSPSAEFFDRSTGAAFTLRGNNYIRLANLNKPNGNPVLAHSTFIVGLYDANRAESALANMQADGYNIVTVIMEGCCQGAIGDPAGGLNSAYIANFVDFLHRAKAHAIGVVIASQWLPELGGFTQPYGGCFPQFDDINLPTLSSCGITAVKTYFQDFVQALINASAPMDAIFAYEIWDEYYYNSSAAPLNATSGMVTTANGQTYDMSIAASKQRMMDDGLVYYADQVRAAILALDPTALVTISFFPPQGPNPSRIGDQRIIQVYPAIASSTLDYVDLHPYPIVLNLTMDQAAQNYGFVGYQQQKPILMGEYGAFMWAYATASNAAAGLQSWQIQSCAYNFKGWVLWTWDTDEQPELWNALSSGGPINTSLAPSSRPNPCSP
jgi:hypothetical protein